jgi:nuclear pore complex protein Nup98-Nup96
MFRFVHFSLILSQLFNPRLTLTPTQFVESSTLLGLPLTGDARIAQTAEMSRRYYGVIMAGGY